MYSVTRTQLVYRTYNNIIKHIIYSIFLLLYMSLSNDDNDAYLRDTAQCKYEYVRDRNNYFDRCGRRIHGTRTCFIFFYFLPPASRALGAHREDMTTTRPLFCVHSCCSRSCIIILCYIICNIILICRESHTSHEGKRVGFQTFSRRSEDFLSFGCFSNVKSVPTRLCTCIMIITYWIPLYS